MSHYELLFVLPGTVAENEVGVMVERVTKVVTEAGAQNVKSHDFGKNRLAYPMKHIRYGYFHICRFDAEPAVVPQIQGKLRLMAELLRALIQECDPKSTPVIEFGKELAPAKVGKGVDLTLPEIAQAPQSKKTKEKEEKPAEDAKVSMEDIDKKLDEILDKDMANV